MTAAPPAPLSLPELPLAAVLARIDSLFGIAAMRADLGQDRTALYYAQSRIGYDRRHSARGCMHMALGPAGYLAQPETVIAQAREIGARRVLELGAGLGFNARHVAAALPGVEVLGMDRLAAHVGEAGRRAAAEGLGNLRFLEGRHEAFPEGLGLFDVIFAVETLCYADDPAGVAGQIARHLAPGGRLVLFEPLASAGLPGLGAEMRLASELYWLGVAVTQPLRWPGEWIGALGAAGLRPAGRKDLSLASLPGVLKMHQEALAMTGGPKGSLKGRLAFKAMPAYLARNAVTALLGPYLMLGPGPLADLAAGSCRYWRLVLEKPASEAPAPPQRG